MRRMMILGLLGVVLSGCGAEFETQSTAMAAYAKQPDRTQLTAGQMMARFDTDRNGRLDRKEFVRAFMTPVPGHPGPMGPSAVDEVIMSAEHHLLKFDSNRSGALTLGELDRALQHGVLWWIE